MSSLSNIFVKDGVVVDRDTEGATEYAPLDVLKTVALRIKPLKWKAELATYTAENYALKPCRSGYDAFEGQVKMNVNPFPTLGHAMAHVQRAHENRALSYIDLGAWKEKK